jgi:hypothetical protein
MVCYINTGTELIIPKKRQQVPLKSWYESTKIDSAMSQKASIFIFTAVRTSNLVSALTSKDIATRRPKTNEFEVLRES